MANFVAHFSVEADDLDRAQAFYRDVFGWRFEAWGPPDFFLVFTPPAPGMGLTEGAMSKRRGPMHEAGLRGYRCTISVEDVEAKLAEVIEHGGAKASDIIEIPGVGKLCEVTDTEGNYVCIMRYVDSDPRSPNYKPA
ncbi:MAG: VOC family protein [Myxococcota bacterium]